ncbi:ABC transporter permease [Inconstantimicrobium porci]|uniref:ABC transporter permease n=1 Tax=Inconstantimicrobium porci TaxID=2652291 RepID=A0A7X2T230_9CLOT|nr:ABC transporter permease [Inconstantimicrobium porci]MSR92222.1 ABC transporter permease [Inconstantimicrobium porci]
MNMMEFSYRNVFRNIKAYAAYFISSTISASLMFSFSMIILHPDFNTDMFPDALKNALYVSIFIAYFFLCFFVFYSESVFLKSRYKDFGVLYIIGASRKQIKKMITIENLIITSSAGVFGVIIGLVFSKILIAACGRILGVTSLNFYLPVKSILITITAFIVIGFVVSLSASMIITEDKVLKLLKGTRKPKAEPKFSKLLTLVSLITLITGYFLSATTTQKNFASRVIIVTSMVVVATYFIFSQVSIRIIHLLKSRKKIYMNRTKMLCISDMLYRVKDNARMFFLITITSAVALTSIGGIYVYWNSKEAEINSSFPQSFFIYDYYNHKDDVERKISFIKSSLYDKKVDSNNVCGTIKYVSVKDIDDTVLVSRSTYDALKKSNSMSKYKFNEYKKKVLPAIFDDVKVVDEDVFNSTAGKKIYFTAVNVSDYKTTLDISREYLDKFNSLKRDKYSNDFLKSYIHERTKVGYGVLLFSCVFIGLVFFITTASFLYNKCYMDIIEDKQKYCNLSKIGLTFKEIKKILNVEIGILFVLPYSVSMLHFIFAISALKSAADVPVLNVALQVIGVMIVVQIIYYFIIRKNYIDEIIKEIIV